MNSPSQNPKVEWLWGWHWTHNSEKQNSFLFTIFPNSQKLQEIVNARYNCSGGYDINRIDESRAANIFVFKTDHFLDLIIDLGVIKHQSRTQ